MIVIVYEFINSILIHFISYSAYSFVEESKLKTCDIFHESEKQNAICVKIVFALRERILNQELLCMHLVN